MSNIIPPLLSNSPPPPPSPEEEEEDEFGDFTVANDLSYGCDGFSPLPSPDLSSGERSPFKILNAVDHVLQKTKEENSVLDLDGLENKTSKCDCSEEINSLGFDKLGKNSGIRSDKLRESVEIIPVSDISNSVSKHSSSSDFKAKENECFKTNNNEDPFETFDHSHIGNIEISHFSDEPEVDTCSPIYSEEGSSPQNGLEQTSASVDENFETIKSTWDFDGNSKKSAADISADLEIVDIFSKSEFLDANCEVPDPTKSACVSDSSVIERDSSKLSEPSSYEFLSDIQEKSEVFVEKTHEESLKSINIDEAKAENGEFTIFSSKVEENLAVKSDSTKKNCEISKSSEESKNPAEFAVNVDPDVFSWHSPFQNEADVESDDEFADFASHQANPEPHVEIAILPSDKQDDFEDFGEFTSTICATTPATPFPDEEDDFQSFADFSKIPESACLQLDEKQAFSKAEQIIKEMFPASEDVVEDFGYFELAENDFIFKQLQDVTDTPALTYQWSKSAGQKALLKSLNIDARNILYGPSWNSSIPRFAANLGLQPLEPIKTEHPTSSVLKPSPSTSQNQNVDIPSAQFDWTGSGLVNPLDSLPKDAVSSLPDPRGPSELPAKKSPGTIFELSNPTPENASASKLDDNDFEDFTSYQSPEILQVPEWTNALPLRESYISNTTPEAPPGPGIEAWLQPTILTPELPRRTMTEAVDEDTSPKVVANDENDDEFTEFHGVHDTTVVVGDCGSQKVVCDFLSDFDSIKTEGLVSEVASSGKQAELTSFDRIQVEGVVESKSVSENGPVEAEEDEFTDFQSSKPQTTDPVLFCAPIMEPLKPVQVHANNAPTQINWPDPGITNEDIRKFEEVFSRPAPPKQEEPVKPPAASPEKQQTSSDNEEWTDFVSVKKPSPVHKLRTNDRDRTSSPDLPLSVFNLGMVQPMKQPIPVITPHGLVQTRLSAGSAISSASSATSSPKTQARYNANNCLPLQPLTISEQYVSHAYNFSAPPSYGNSGQTKSNATSSNWSFASQAAQEEDEWGEFVSSPLPPQRNGHPPSAAGWGGSNTNIITNPRHFGGGRVSNKGAVSNLVLPELDFVAPKGRTTTSRKK